MKREIKILEKLRGIKNVQEMVEWGRCPLNNSLYIVFPYQKSHKYITSACSFEEIDLQLYIYQLLKAAKEMHAQGIMHRNIKRKTVLWNFENKEIMITSFDKAVFYSPGEAYSIPIYGFNNKPPEMLLGDPYYTPAVDIWSIGILFASMVY